MLPEGVRERVKAWNEGERKKIGVFKKKQQQLIAALVLFLLEWRMRAE